MSFAALMSGICLANAGLGAVHGLAGTIGALYDIPHGVVCGTLMAPANEVNVRELRRVSRSGAVTDRYSAAVTSAVLGKYATLGRIFADATGKNDNYYIDFFTDCLNVLSYRLRMPKLSRYGLVHDDLAAICSLSDVKNNPVCLSEEQMLEILMSRI